jgi:hypothetical protein
MSNKVSNSEYKVYKYSHKNIPNRETFVMTVEYTKVEKTTPTIFDCCSDAVLNVLDFIDVEESKARCSDSDMLCSFGRINNAYFNIGNVCIFKTKEMFYSLCDDFEEVCHSSGDTFYLYRTNENMCQKCIISINNNETFDLFETYETYIENCETRKSKFEHNFDNLWRHNFLNIFSSYYNMSSTICIKGSNIGIAKLPLDSDMYFGLITYTDNSKLLEHCKQLGINAKCLVGGLNTFIIRKELLLVGTKQQLLDLHEKTQCFYKLYYEK